MLTLYGPPGTGKSSLARVVAKQSGYEPREINASNMRSANDLIEAMTNALTQNSHFAKGEEKPVCLIIDEVDGAVGGAIGANFQKVVDFIKKCISKIKAPKTDEDAAIGSDEENDDDGATHVRKTKTKKKDAGFDLKRPIIFVCNDMYAKPLRSLRELSLQVKIPEANKERLIQRMRQICKLENVKIEDNVITNLAASTNQDARASINAL